MTTIAYRNGVMASDSQVTDENSNTKAICGPKIVCINNVLIGCRGDSDHRPVHNWFRAKKIRTLAQLLRHSPKIRGDWTALVVFPDGAIATMDIDKHGSCMEVVQDPFFAVGTGGPLARAAMAAHSEVTAERAVWAACAIDLHSCLPVQTMRLKE